nr:ShlB/FhaC/HecB family hemolysin secretion/activation protein [Yersinia intermedia]
MIIVHTGNIPCYLMILVSGYSYAAPSPAERNIIQLEQQQLLERSQQQRDELQIITPKLMMPPSPSLSQPQPCFVISRIAYLDSTLLSSAVQQHLNSPYIGQCLSLIKINKLLADISNYYIERGYITSRAFLTEQDLAEGVLNIRILEGKLEDIQFNHHNASMLMMAFPHLKGEMLNLRDIEQGMEQINRLRTRQVQIEILPGSKPGYSIVNLTSQPKFPLTFALGNDNSGQKSTGVSQLNASVNADNLLGFADQWFVAGSHSSEFSNSHNARSLQAGVSVPFGYWNIDYSYAWSDYLNVIPDRNYSWRSTGDSRIHRGTLSRVVFRNANMKTALSFGITHRVSQNYLDAVRLQSSSRNLSSGIIGISHSQKLFGGLATFNPTFSRGTPWFGAENDDLKNGDVPQAEFNKWALSASYYHPLNDSVSYLTSLYGQHSNDRLYGSEQLTLGGESSVRGFKEQYLSGNNGGYWRNEVSWQALQLPLLGNLSLIAALDGGWLKHDKQDKHAEGTLWGSAIGITSNGRYFSSQFTVGKPLCYPGWLKPDNTTFYYRIGIVI